jgi:hypothetical protein
MNNRKEYKRQWNIDNKDRISKRRKITDKEYYLNNKERILKRNSDWLKTEAGKLVSRRKKLKRYGITIDQYDALLKLQNNCCKICSTHESEFNKRLAVDHCHTTGKVRGLLCMACNILLGKAKDNINTLNNAIDYLNNNNNKDN